MKDIKIFYKFFIFGLGFLIWGYFSIRHFYIMDVKKGIAEEQYDVDVSYQITSFFIGFYLTISSLSKILHSLWGDQGFTYLLIMAYAILIYFAHGLILKKLHIKDEINYYAMKIESYIYLLVALYQLFHFIN